jgi:hypothetical protein
MHGSQRRTAVGNRNTNQNVIRAFLGIFGSDIKVAIPIKDTRVSKFQLRQTSTAMLILRHQPRIGILDLRILV